MAHHRCVGIGLRRQLIQLAVRNTHSYVHWPAQSAPRIAKPPGALCAGRRELHRPAVVGLACGAGEVGGDDVSGVPVEGDPGAVVAHRCARVGVRCGFLHIAQRHAGIECCGDEGVAQGVRADGLVDTGATGDAANDPAGAVAVHPLAVRPKEDRAVESFADGEIDGSGGARCEWDGDDLAALAQHGEGAVSAFDAEGVDVGAEGFRDPQPV